MAYISRSRSLSVSTAPLTFATALPVGCTVVVWNAEDFAFVAGACEATCASTDVVRPASRSAIRKRYFIVPLSLRPQKRGKGPPFPRSCNRCLLEHGRNIVGVIGFVRLAKVALTAELSRRG